MTEAEHAGIKAAFCSLSQLNHTGAVSTSELKELRSGVLHQHLRGVLQRCITKEDEMRCREQDTMRINLAEKQREIQRLKEELKSYQQQRPDVLISQPQPHSQGGKKPTKQRTLFGLGFRALTHIGNEQVQVCLRIRY